LALETRSTLHVRWVGMGLESFSFDAKSRGALGPRPRNADSEDFS